MKKWIYLLIVTVTIYLNLLYEWKEGGVGGRNYFFTVLSDDGCFWEAKNQCLYEDGSDHAGAKRKLRRKDSSEKSNGISSSG